MADLGSEWNVNTEQLPEAKSFDPIPVGDYTYMFVNSKLAPTNKTKEKMDAAGVSDYDEWRKSNPRAEGMLVLEADVQDEGQYKGRKVFVRLNLINDNAQAVEIAAAQLKQILEALGMKHFSGKSEELHNKRFVGQTIVKQGNEYKDKKTGEIKQGQPQNEIKKFLKAGSGSVGGSAPAQAATGTGGKSPWARG